MTTNRNLKRRVRARSAKTGESYSAARHQLVGGTTGPPRTIRLAVAQMPLHPDPGDAGQLRESGGTVRSMMREAHAAGADLVQFPEGALTSPGKRIMSSTGPDEIGPADWDRADWPALAQELDVICRLAGELGIWVVVGGIHRSVAGDRPRNCLYVIADDGRVADRYDERMLSKTKSTYMYAPGREPVVFGFRGARLGCAAGMETHYAELFAAYEELDVDGVLFSTHGNPDDAGVFAIEAAGHAAANSIWVTYSGPAGGTEPPAGILGPHGTWVARCAGEGVELAVADLEIGTSSPAREWRRRARAGLRT
jgi:predicted amidohydrolase